MSTVVNDLVKELNNANIPGLGKAYPFQMGVNTRTKPDTADVLVSDIDFDFGTYGSDLATKQNQSLQISIFYSKDKKPDMNEFENSLMSFLMQRKWSVLPYGGHSIDPTSGETTLVFQIKRRITWNYKV